jgi:O-antigen/teichoic acid export membrane protein
LLLAGRVFSKFLNFALQIAIVRGLSKGDYGVFAYGLSVVALAEACSRFGLARAVTRFVPYYQERGDRARLLGTLAASVAAMALFGIASIGVSLAYVSFTTGDAPEDRAMRTVLAILIGLAPFQALDKIAMSLFAVLGRAREIAFRKHVAQPLLRLAVVAILLVADQDVKFLAAGYLVTGVITISSYALQLARMLDRQGWFEGVAWRDLRIPWREIAVFSAPLFVYELVQSALHMMDSVMLGYLCGAEEVARLRAVHPLVLLSELVFLSFGTLFPPQAARLHARGDLAGLQELYRRTAAWVALLTFPLFAIPFGLAEPVSAMLFGEAYRDSGRVMALLVPGFFFQVVFGFNVQVLTASGRLGSLFGANVATALVGFVANLHLIPKFGAEGAALGTSLAIALQTALQQRAMHRETGIRLLGSRYDRCFASLALGSLLCLAVLLSAERLTLSLQIAGCLGAVAIVLAVNRSLLDLAETFPELARVPFLRSWIDSTPARTSEEKP